MSIDSIWAALKQAWAYAPLPWLLPALIVIGFAWLWVEYQTTRVARAIPVWRRPVPLFPQISLAFGWVIRAARGLLILWLILLVILAVNFWAATYVDAYPPSANRILTDVGRAWHQGYGFVTDRLPDGAPDWLLPPRLEEAG